MGSLWEDLTGIKSHSVGEISEAVKNAVEEADREIGRGAVSAQREAVQDRVGRNFETDLSEAVAAMNAPQEAKAGEKRAQAAVLEPEITAEEAEAGEESPDIGV